MFNVRFFRFSGTVLLAVLSLVNLSYAERAKVYSGEYVVTEVPGVQALNNGPVQNQNLTSNLNRLRSLGGNHSLIKKELSSGGVAALTTREIVEHDPSDDYCQQLIAAGDVLDCSPNFVYQASVVPNDSNLSGLWGLNSQAGIDAYNAWDTATGSGNVVVAVIDTGIDYNHNDLKANIWKNTQEIPNNGIDDDQNGYIDDYYGFSAVSSTPFDDNGHGTHVAGIIGAKGNNGTGIAGVNWNVKLLPLKFLDANGFGGLSDAVAVINYMTNLKQRGVNIVVSNNSWGGVGFSSVLQTAIKNSINAGIVFVAAAGNEATNIDDTPSYPAGYLMDGLVSVAAIDQNQNLAGFSNYGQYNVDIAAPGVNIISTVPGNSYHSLSGTSMAAPFVAGAIGLLKSHNPGYTPEQLIDQLYETGSDLATVNGITRTGRKLNLNRLVKNYRTPLAPPSAPDGCSYDSTSISYAPDLSANNSPIVIQADEYVFETINLPFDFPFYNTKVRTLIVSPNGVIYTKGQPSSTDHQNYSQAPANSIAVLHTDLTAEVSPQGVRYKVNTNSVTIYWRMKHYLFRNGGDVEAHATLYSDGRIKVAISTNDNYVLNQLRTTATIGLSGENASEVNTEYYNSSSLSAPLAVQYTPSCVKSDPTNPDNGNAVLSTIMAYSLKRNGKQINKAIGGRSLYVTLSGSGTGFIPLKARINGYKCSGDRNVALQNGQGNTTIIVPRGLRQFSKLKLYSGSVSRRLTVKGNARLKENRALLRQEKVKYRKIARKVCRSLF